MARLSNEEEARREELEYATLMVLCPLGKQNSTLHDERANLLLLPRSACLLPNASLLALLVVVLSRTAQDSPADHCIYYSLRPLHDIHNLLFAIHTYPTRACSLITYHRSRPTSMSGLSLSKQTDHPSLRLANRYSWNAIYENSNTTASSPYHDGGKLDVEVQKPRQGRGHTRNRHSVSSRVSCVPFQPALLPPFDMLLLLRQPHTYPLLDDYTLFVFLLHVYRVCRKIWCRDARSERRAPREARDGSEFWGGVDGFWI